MAEKVILRPVLPNARSEARTPRRGREIALIPLI